MIAIITYDITGNRERNRLHGFLKELGIPGQKSVFECNLNRDELKEFRDFCGRTLDLEEDSVRVYRICRECLRKAAIQGKGISFVIRDWAVV